MVFGIKNKKSAKKLSKQDAPQHSNGNANATARHHGHQTNQHADADPGLTAAPPSFKYGGNVSKRQFDIAGLPVNVFGIDELTPAPSRASAPQPPQVCVVIHLHGRGGSADNEEKIARQLHDRIQRDKDAFQQQHPDAAAYQRDHLVVTFDARNHGHRMTNQLGQQAWKQGNQNHALDLYGMIVGGARDTSFIVDLLAPYLFQHDERTVAEWVVTGKSLGGHSTWHVLANEPRIRIGVPFIGMPDYNRLLNSRTKTSFVTNGPPYVPGSLKSLINQIDPSVVDHESFDPARNPFWGKKICVLSGAEDRLVLWDWNEKFLKELVVGEPSGPRGEMDGLKIHRYSGVGHEVTESMVEEAGEWIWRWGVAGQAAR
ncbi:uncharacterized protein PFL1_00261 [Pseudozyma flocculosa PF-1]|uniref:Alpha/beta-hydrolase n=1 Tax=Pseudozyma flocculosa TaxID=84751 RepID=A0A5C3EU55_9BASI|nr:uncharacterized protein PFL1_00261 [Pseudozyma flocculosa PF-1]EPQ32063.1 hypothetical protein PFL1_00261 [Pseudozyma flocculosa PF-1]SPO35007.1 uncharacterized protein PSFLO_00478 [Pseudozyma flocculosa]